MDPEIAALLGTGDSPSGGATALEEFPELDDDSALGASEGGDETDLTATTFPPVTKKLMDVPHKGLTDPAYYKVALSGEGDIAQRVHNLVQKYINTKDPKDRGVFRQQLATAYWEFFGRVAHKATGQLADPKKYLLRFGILHPTFLDAETREFFSKIIIDNELGQPVYYLDEWFKAVGNGSVRNSSTDEANVPKSNEQIRLQQLLDKAIGKRDGSKGLLRAKDDERKNLEKALTERVSAISEHFPLNDFPEINACYSDSQKKVFVEIQELLKNMLKSDRDLDSYLKDFYEAEADVNSLQDKVDAGGGAEAVNTQALDSEYNTVRQMAKMTIGRQGNHFPILTKEYFHCTPNDVAFRENVVASLAWIESLDPEAFCRSYKNRVNRIVPYVVLVPSYGDYGVCWEPFDRFNRATSRGRIALPMYPKSLPLAVLSAVADLRWQVAKEKASYYWMEEGITGNYYQWFQKQKLKGDLKEYFIQDYVTWMTKESEGTQKLDKELRGIFWRYMPFPQVVKEKLKGRSFAYQELYQRDMNRAMSDGY